jgi:phosphoribosyl-ATP pyrophosphohydrolase
MSEKVWTELELYEELVNWTELMEWQDEVSKDEISKLVEELMVKLNNHELEYDDVYDELTELRASKEYQHRG